MGRFSVLPAKPPPLCILGFRPPTPVTFSFPAPFNPLLPLAGSFDQVLPISHPYGAIFGFACQTAPPLCISGFRPPRLATCSSPTPYNPLLPLAGGFDQVLPILHPYGAIFSFACQTAPPCASWASGPPALQPVPLSHPTTPCYH